MLRSLVGSEMCIRDSTENVVKQLYKQFTTEEISDMIARLITPSGLDIPCLLYTSDAADDLLCVDLGGRRIIKKKNILEESLTQNIS